MDPVLAPEVVRLLEYYRTWQIENGVPADELVYVPGNDHRMLRGQGSVEEYKPVILRGEVPKYPTEQQLRDLVRAHAERGELWAIDMIWKRETDEAMKKAVKRSGKPPKEREAKLVILDGPSGSGDNTLVINRLRSWWLPQADHKAWRDSLVSKLERKPMLDAWPLMEELKVRIAQDGWYVDGNPPVDSVVS